MPRSYPPEFRRRVLDLVKAGRPVRQVAADLDMPSQTISALLQARPSSRVGTGGLVIALGSQMGGFVGE